MTNILHSLKTHSDYRYSNLPWLREIPAHWNLLQLRYIAEIYLSGVDKKSYDDEPSVMLCNYTDVYNNDLITDDLNFMVATASLDAIKRLTLRADDVIITKDSESWEDIAVPAYVPRDLANVVCGYHLALLRPNSQILGKYLFWSFLARNIAYQFHVSAGGITRFGLSQQAIKEAYFLVPPKEEQIAIVKFLDAETGKIDTLIREFGSFHEFIIQKRQALVSHAVIRGVKSDASFADTGFEWIGEIPNHWHLEFTRWLLPEVDERSVTGEEELLTVSHITGVTLRSEKDVNMFEAESNEGYKLCQPGDLVINTLWAWMGAMGVAFQEGIVSPAYHVYRHQGDYDPQYLDYLVRLPNFAKEVARYSKGVWSSRLRLYPDEFYKIVLPVPPLDEQREIVAYLDKEIAKLDELSKAVQETIELLKERRSALIAAAVTGKIRVTE